MELPDMPETASNTGGSNEFLKLKDGESIYLICRGEIQRYCQYWQDKKPFICEPGHPDAKWRFRVNVLTCDLKLTTYQAKVWDGGVLMYQELQELNTEFDVSENFIKLKRTGEMLDTVWSLIPASKVKLTDAIKETMKKLPPLDLDKIMADQLTKQKTFNTMPVFDAEKDTFDL